MGADRLTSDAKTPETPPKAAVVDDTVRRLQIGVGGVVAVLLLVAMAGLASDRARQNVTASVDDTQDVQSSSVSMNNTAPLEELGVQPVSKDKDTGAAMIMPPPLLEQGMSNTARGAVVPDLEPDPELQRARQYNP